MPKRLAQDIRVGDVIPFFGTVEHAEPLDPWAGTPPIGAQSRHLIVSEDGREMILHEDTEISVM